MRLFVTHRQAYVTPLRKMLPAFSMGGHPGTFVIRGTNDSSSDIRNDEPLFIIGEDDCCSGRVNRIAFRSGHVFIAYFIA
ncbi:hypothetical protein MTO96_040064 [Rhipicephalus appendiculatus]